jgi:hypothetical protein
MKGQGANAGGGGQGSGAARWEGRAQAQPVRSVWAYFVCYRACYTTWCFWLVLEAGVICICCVERSQCAAPAAAGAPALSDESGNWSKELVDVDLSLPLPMDTASISAFLQEQLSRPLPVSAVAFQRLSFDPAAGQLAHSHLVACGTADSLMIRLTAVGFTL